MDEKKIDEEIIKNAIDDLEACERRLPELAETPGPIDQVRPSPSVAEVKEPDIEGPEKRETDRLRLFALIFLISALVISGILLLYLDS